MAVRFMICFVIGNFYVINLVQVLELVFLSYRVTLILFTFLPAFLAMVKIYHIPVIPYCKKLLEECKHYILRELGFRTFLSHRLQEIKKPLKIIFRNFVRWVREIFFDLPFLFLFAFIVWKVCGNGLLHNWGYGASDIPVHNYWINGLVENKIYIAGIYPMGMHCMIYYLCTVLKIPVYVGLRLFWLVQYTMIAGVMLAFLKCCGRTRFISYVGPIAFVGLKYFAPLSYSRFGATLPQEYGMLYILPSIYFLFAFFQTREHELKTKVNKIRCESTWNLLGFSLSFSLTLTAHFYDTIIAGILCVGVAIGYGYWFFRKSFFGRIMLAGILSILLAFLPMAAALLTGKSLQGSMYWAMSIIGLRDYTVLVFRIICGMVLAITIGAIVWIYRAVKKGKISFENHPVKKRSIIGMLIFQMINLAGIAGFLYLGWMFKDQLLNGIATNTFQLPDMYWFGYGIALAVLIALIQRYIFAPMTGAVSIAVICAEIAYGLILISGSMGWPMLMEPYRITIYAAYMIPVIVTMALDSVVNIVCFGHFQKFQRFVVFVTIAAGVAYGWKYQNLGNRYQDYIRAPFGGGGLEMNEAILCTTNIMEDNKGADFSWTIISANDELRMIENYGRHTETIEFLYDMEHWNEKKEVTIPTEKVYFYIEKKPLNYANGYNGEIPVVSKEQAKKALPGKEGLNAYQRDNRSITMSRMYYWAQKFKQLYPNEMKVYFEDDKFVCYMVEQNTYRLYNFAIQYGYN